MNSRFDGRPGVRKGGRGADIPSHTEARPAVRSLMDDPIELVLKVRVELPDELVTLLRQLAIPSAAPMRADTDKTWTKERKEALRRMWPAGKSITEVRKLLERLPGTKLPSNTAIAAYANVRLGVSRPPGFRRRRPRQRPSLPP